MSPSAIKQIDEEVGPETILQLSPLLSQTSSLDALISLLALTYKTRIPSPYKQDRLLTLLYTISLVQPVTPRIYSHEETLNSFIRYLSPALTGMAGLQDFEKAVQDEVRKDPEGFRAFWMLDGRDLVRDLVGDGSMGGTSPGAEVVFLDTFVGKEGGSKRVALGSEGTLFRVDDGMEEGERVMVVRDEDRLEGRLSFCARGLGANDGTGGS